MLLCGTFIDWSWFCVETHKIYVPVEHTRDALFLIKPSVNSTWRSCYSIRHWARPCLWSLNGIPLLHPKREKILWKIQVLFFSTRLQELNYWYFPIITCSLFILLRNHPKIFQGILSRYTHAIRFWEFFWLSFSPFPWLLQWCRNILSDSSFFSPSASLWSVIPWSAGRCEFFPFFESMMLYNLWFCPFTPL